jgi:hypothetical protein
MFSLSTKAAFSDPLGVSLMRAQGARPAGGSGPFNYSITLGAPHPNRKYYILLRARTNSSTGNMRPNLGRIIYNSVNYDGTLIAGTTSNSSVPWAIYELTTLVDGSGAATLSINFNGGPVAFALTCYEVRGRYDLIDFVGGGSSMTLDTVPNGVFLHFASSDNDAISISPSYTVQDLSYSTTGLQARGGRFFPTSGGSQTVTASAGDLRRTIGVTLG